MLKYNSTLHEREKVISHSIINDHEYKTFLTEIKRQYRASQLKAAFSINKEMIRFYWSLGKKIIDKQKKTQWGSNFINQLSDDLRREFPGTKGFSVRNLERMRQFFKFYPDLIPAQPVPKLVEHPIIQLPWGHIVLLIQKVKDQNARDWYIQSILRNGTARSVLTIQIEQDLYERQGKDTHKITNFSHTLPKPQSDLALQLFKDPYDFRFLPVTMV